MNQENTFGKDFWIYVSRFREFNFQDWAVYIVWIGMMLGLLFSVSFFTIGAYAKGVDFPDYVWSVPIGTFIFILAIGIDTIGHRTKYKEALQKGENLVHHITIFGGVTSILLLCLCYQYAEMFMIPAFVLVALSVFYSMIDEAMHWFRYHEGNSDRVEMWSHYFIFVGHNIMVAAWCYWFIDGYPGVKEALEVLF